MTSIVESRPTILNGSDLLFALLDAIEVDVFDVELAGVTLSTLSYLHLNLLAPAADLTPLLVMLAELVFGARDVHNVHVISFFDIAGVTIRIWSGTIDVVSPQPVALRGVVPVVHAIGTRLWAIWRDHVLDSTHVPSSQGLVVHA